MFVEYLFEINPFTFLLIMASLVFFVAQSVRKPAKYVRTYDKTLVDYKSYKKIDEQAKKNTILIMSYNIMAYNFTKIEWFPYCPPEYLHPKYRAPRILNEIEEVNADVLCLQECDHDLFIEFYKPNLEAMGYTCIFKSITANRIVTNCIAYKKKLFREETWSHLDLNEELDKLDDSFVRHKEALFINLRHYASGKNILIANTHLFWNTEFEYVKYGQMCMILKYIQNKYPNLPVVLCGDLNSTPNSNVIKYVYKKAPEVSINLRGDHAKNKKFMEQLWTENPNKLDLRSAYDVYKVSNVNDYKDYADNHPDFSVYTHEFIGTLDYIFYSQKDIEVVELLKLPTHDHEVKAQKLPNAKYPSDHLKIGARFKFI
jgi:CCR4-NOT transcription complex subunit 6